MKYEITEKGRLKITDSKTNKSFKVPKKFSYLKLVEGEDEEYQFTFCTKKGDVLSDYKKYNKVDDKFKYIDTGVINDEEIDLEELYDEERIFSVKPSKTDKEIATIFDIDDNIEIGTLSDSMPIGDERKIIAHYNGEGRAYITLLDVLKATAPEAFDGHGKFQYLNDNIDFKLGVEIKTINNDKRVCACGNFSYFNEYYCTDSGTYIGINSKEKQGDNSKGFFTDNDYLKLQLKYNPNTNHEPIYFIHEDYPLQIIQDNKTVFTSPVDNDILVYAPDYML